MRQATPEELFRLFLFAVSSTIFLIISIICTFYFYKSADFIQIISGVSKPNGKCLYSFFTGFADFNQNISDSTFYFSVFTKEDTDITNYSIESDLSLVSSDSPNLLIKQQFTGIPAKLGEIFSTSLYRFSHAFLEISVCGNITEILGVHARLIQTTKSFTTYTKLVKLLFYRFLCISLAIFFIMTLNKHMQLFTAPHISLILGVACFTLSLAPDHLFPFNEAARLFLLGASSAFPFGHMLILSQTLCESRTPLYHIILVMLTVFSDAFASITKDTSILVSSFNGDGVIWVIFFTFGLSLKISLFLLIFHNFYIAKKRKRNTTTIGIICSFITVVLLVPKCLSTLFLGVNGYDNSSLNFLSDTFIVFLVLECFLFIQWPNRDLNFCVNVCKQKKEKKIKKTDESAGTLPDVIFRVDSDESVL